MGNNREKTADVVVIGGGIIGLSVARELAGAGAGRVVVVERGQLGRGASHYAAGMLAPQAEADARDAFFDFAHESRRMYVRFAAELKEETGVDVELDETGILYLAFSHYEEKEIERRFTWQRAANLSVEYLTSTDALRLEPRLSPAVRAALLFPDDGQVENRRLTHALAASCAGRGVELLTCTEVSAVETNREGTSVRAVLTPRGRIETPLVVVASGAWASRLARHTNDSHAPLSQITIEPVRGQMLQFEASPPLVRHVIYSPRAYLVPRRDGRLLVGATTEYVDFDVRVTAAGLHALTAGALEISAHTGDLPLRDTWAGLRPRAADGLPVIGRDREMEGLIFAVGHYRNGILLAPLTARLVRELVFSTDAVPEKLEPFSPARFNKVMCAAEASAAR